jgi:hypothetical protein
LEKKHIHVVDVRANAPAEEIERALSAPLEGDYYLGTMYQEGGIIRAVYKLRTRQLDGDAGAEFVRQNPKMSVERIRVELAAKGIRRSKDWIEKVKKDV